MNIIYPLSDFLTIIQEIWFIQEIVWVLLYKIILSSLSKTNQKGKQERRIWDYCFAHKNYIFRIYYSNDSSLRDFCTSGEVKHENWSFWATYIVLNTSLQIIFYPTCVSDYYHSEQIDLKGFGELQIYKCFFMKPVSNQLSQNFKLYLKLNEIKFNFWREINILPSSAFTA